MLYTTADKNIKSSVKGVKPFRTIFLPSPLREREINRVR
jgi:hypothetical protein